MSVITIEIPEAGEARNKFVEDIVDKIVNKWVTGPFADVLFDVQERTANASEDITKVRVMSRTEDDGKIADHARVATLRWPEPSRSVAEEIYYETRR